MKLEPENTPVIVAARRTPICTSSGDKIPPEEGGDGIEKYK